ncbi:MAG: hypothetical protein PWQ82_1049 [Thermosediminibacterales bacterium]|nr:hypothetical protein [Thermosediminibacterales bacterium]MDK2836302.1 hypothetical protein [Thermosediminibacterales bacterium]
MKPVNKQVYKYRAEILKALAHPLRLAIVDYLGDGEKCVCDIIDYLGEKQSNVSRHLSLLRQTGIVDTRKEGLNVYYSLKFPCTNNFFSCVDNILQRQHEEKKAVLKQL